VKRTAPEQAATLPLELDAVACNDVFDGMRQLECVGVDPPRSIGGAGNLDGHTAS
jgi:hypothetical protein